MASNRVVDSIRKAYGNLYGLNVDLHDYWISELYDVNGEMTDKWNEETLAQMEKDVMMNS